MKNKLPSKWLLTTCLNYNQETGIFRWKIEPRPARPLIGEIAGTLSKSQGYIFIKVKGFPQIGGHRIAWIYAHGQIPDGFEVDHRDRNRSNNSISNLRLATSSQQKMNKGVQSNNRSGLKGAFYHACRPGKKWRSQIKIRSALKFIGYFDTAEEAHAAYMVEAKKAFGVFALREAA